MPLSITVLILAFISNYSTGISKSISNSAAIAQAYALSQRTELGTRQQLHFELHPCLSANAVATEIICKPVAKCGIRLHSASSRGMDEVIGALNALGHFAPTDHGSGRDHLHTKHDLQSDVSVSESVLHSPDQLQIGVLVYLFVEPVHRGQGLGSHLLRTAKQHCAERGDQYMLLTRDERGAASVDDRVCGNNCKSIDGSSTEQDAASLIGTDRGTKDSMTVLQKFYAERHGFVDIDHFIPNGMLSRL